MFRCIGVSCLSPMILYYKNAKFKKKTLNRVNDRCFKINIVVIDNSRKFANKEWMPNILHPRRRRVPWETFVKLCPFLSAADD